MDLTRKLDAKKADVLLAAAVSIAKKPISFLGQAEHTVTFFAWARELHRRGQETADGGGGRGRRPRTTPVGPYDLGKTTGEGTFARNPRSGGACANKVLNRNYVLRHKIGKSILPLLLPQMARGGGGYVWALAAGLNAALAAISAKFFAPMLLKYGMVILFNLTMWGCYVNSLKALSSLQATVTNFAANFISSGLAGYFLFEEPLPSKWFAGASLIILGVFILSKSSIEEKVSSD